MIFNNLYRRDQDIPMPVKLSIGLLFLVLIATGLTGLFTYTTLPFYHGPYNYNILPVSPLFELTFLSIAMLGFLAKPLNDRGARMFFLISLVYLITTFFIAYFSSPASIKDYLLAYKAFVYTLLLCFLVNRRAITFPAIKYLLYFMLAIFLIKYGYSRWLNVDERMGSRPGVYMENNFELVFLVLLYFLAIDQLKHKLWTFIIMILVVYLSGSRSAMLCLFAVYFCSAIRTWASVRFRWLLICPFLLLLIASVVLGRMDISMSQIGTQVYHRGEQLFADQGPQEISERHSVSIDNGSPEQQQDTGIDDAPADVTTSDIKAHDDGTLDHSQGSESHDETVSGAEVQQKIGSVDRVKFLHMFLESTQNWHWWNYLVGTKPLTPLSAESCQALSYWSTLFSYENDGHCYSVILHSYLLRGIYDHGLIGLLFLNLFLAYGLWKSGYRKIDIVCVTGVLMLSSLSVSAYNSVFYALTMALYFMTPGNRDPRGRATEAMKQ
ncbi:hypothetical protein R84981_000165 [Carnimonas sp. R-84981]|uniref:hypothetical protein n=1 Tax=Carnimonas bestiolae TaxID=3402172 RepID=UPI003EDC3945